METVVHQYLAKKPSGKQVVIEEHWEFVDVSLSRTGTEWAPGGKRFTLANGDALRKIDQDVFQIISTGEILFLM